MNKLKLIISLGIIGLITGGIYFTQFKQEAEEKISYNLEESSISEGCSTIKNAILKNCRLSLETVQDIDGNTYNVKKIGTQYWMTENMRTTKYPNGDPITKGCDAEGCAGWTADIALYSCPPNTDNNAEDCNAAFRYGENAGAGTGEALGMLYQWSAAMDNPVDPAIEGIQGICPEGWHIPTNAEQEILEEYLGSADCRTTSDWECTPAGNKMKTPDKCSVAGDSNCGISGFNGLLTGYRYPNSNYDYRDTHTYLWSSTQSGGNAWTRHLNSGYSDVYRSTHSKAYGFSVRCLKD